MTLQTVSTRGLEYLEMVAINVALRKWTSGLERWLSG